MARFDCILAGDNNLLIVCAEILVDRGHDIRTVITSAADVTAWASDNGISTVRQGNGTAVDTSSLDEVEYLFSIGNYHMLSDELITYPGKLAINVHDAPLPVGAGRFATSWAIAEQRERHGVTWHVLSADFDAGDIVKQRCFPLRPTETTATLDLRCFATIVEEFKELVDELADGRVHRVPQDLSRRTQRTLRERPDSIIDWAWPAERISAAVRSTDFGTRVNPFGSTKLKAGGDFVIPLRARPVDSRSTAAPGTVVESSGDRAIFATTTADVELGPFLTLEGDHIVPQWTVGDRVDDLAEPLRDEVHQWSLAALRAERFWVTRLGSLRPADLPGWARDSGDCLTQRHVEDIPLAGTSTEAALTAVLAFLATWHEDEHFDVGLRTRVPDELGALFFPQVPFRIRPSSDLSEQVRAELEAHRVKGVPLRDLAYRYRSQHEGGYRLPVVIDLVGAREPVDCALLVEIAEPARSCRWTFMTGSVSPTAAIALTTAFRDFVSACA